MFRGAGPTYLQSRRSSGNDLGWKPVRPERVCEVRYDHLQGRRFRHAAVFLRWRPDKPLRECTYGQREWIPIQSPDDDCFRRKQFAAWSFTIPTACIHA